jgi:MFS family permease
LMIAQRKQDTSVWLALTNPVFSGLWVASVISGTCVSAHDTAATWLMNSQGASPFYLSLMATSASLPFFLFTLPAGSISDLTNRRRLFLGSYLWLAGAAGLLAICTGLRLINPGLILATVFLLGIGFAFNAPVWAAIIPEIVRRRELASAVTLGGVQMNLAGIVGPALGGFLLPLLGPAPLFSINALAFLFAAFVISRRYRDRRRPRPHLENFLESFATAARYVRYAPGMQVILARDGLFAVFIAAIPALVPVVALHHLKLQPAQLGVVFTSLGLGSLLGATVVLPYARARVTPNMLTILADLILVTVFVLMAGVRNIALFPIVAILAGISWTVTASELWVAGQRAMPDWARGRMNAVHMMVSQGGIALGGVLWGWAATAFGVETALLGGAILLVGSLVLIVPLSINFAQKLELDPAPLRALHDFPNVPNPEDGPVTVTMEFTIRPEDREEFLSLMNKVRLMFLRNGASLFRVDETLEEPGKFRTEMLVNSWAEHLRQHARITREENELFSKALAMNANGNAPWIRHYLPANRISTPIAFGEFRKQGVASERSFEEN